LDVQIVGRVESCQLLDSYIFQGFCACCVGLTRAKLALQFHRVGLPVASGSFSWECPAKRCSIVRVAPAAIAAGRDGRLSLWLLKEFEI